MKGKIVSESSPVSRFHLKQEVEVQEIFYSKELKTHVCQINGEEFLFEIKKFFFLPSKNILLEGFLLDNSSPRLLQKIAIEIYY